MRGKVMRVVPRDCETINETWISDRDPSVTKGYTVWIVPFQPLIKQGDEWQTVEWITPTWFIKD
ncbi:MAG: hypothetical protein R3F37_02080 [Candidatus Competibacteraceae bacterium]